MNSDISELTIAFLEVDNGETTIISLDSDAILIDCGEDSSSNVIDFLESTNVRTLKLALITHSDLDHAGGVIDVLKNFKGKTDSLAFFSDRVMENNPASEK